MTGIVHVGADPGFSAELGTTLAGRRNRLAEHGVEVLGAGTQDPAHVARLMHRDDTLLLVGVRPLAARLSGTWAYEVELGLTTGYADWVASVLEPSQTPAHDRLLRPELLVQHLLERIDPAHVQVIVTPGPRRALRCLERLLGLAPRTLAAARAGRGLSVAEAELVRAVNAGFAAESWPPEVRTRYVDTAVRELRRAGPRPVRPAPVPSEARQQTAGLDAATAAALERLPVRIVGDPHALTRPQRAARSNPTLGTAAAARAVAAAVELSGSAAQSPLLDESGPRVLLAELTLRSRLRARG